MLFFKIIMAAFAASAASDQTARIFNQLRPMVFQIKTAIDVSAPKNSYGTGFVVRKEGILLTNYHVVAESILEPERYKIFMVDGAQAVPAEVLRVDPINDLAVLRVARKFNSQIDLSKEMPPQGALIYSLGLPEDLNMSIVEGNYNGIINEGPYSKIHMSSPINSGMSGGPTVDANGRLLGVNVSRIVLSNNLSFSVPLKSVRDILDKLDVNMKPPTAVDFEGVISGLLNSAGKKIHADLVTTKGEPRRFGAWNLPALPAEIHCWGDKSSITKEKKYWVISENCFLQNSAYLGRGVSSAEFSIELRDCSRSNLNGTQFFNLLNNNWFDRTKTWQLGSWISRDKLSEFTSPVCTTRKLTNAKGIPMVAHLCIKEFVRYEGVYETALDAVTLLGGDRNLVMKLAISGLTFEHTQEVIKHYVDQISMREKPNAEN